MNLLICVSFMVIIAFASVCDATICEPGSVFRVDCNTCRCSDDGRQYSCTTSMCVSNQDQFVREFTEDGHIILRPKDDTEVKYILDDDDDFILTNDRHSKDDVPYILDEIPSSREENDINHGLKDNFALPVIRSRNTEDEDYISEFDLNDDVDAMK